MVLPGKRKSAALADEAATSLVEVGPRLALQPIKIFAGSFGGPVLYENPAYVSPNKARALCCSNQALSRCRWGAEMQARMSHSRAGARGGEGAEGGQVWRQGEGARQAQGAHCKAPAAP